MSSVMEIAMKEMGQLIEMANTKLKILPGPIINVAGFGAVGDWDGTSGTDDTEAVQAAIDEAVDAGMKTVFFPHGVTGVYQVTELTSVDQVVFIGDNASFSGVDTEIIQFGLGASKEDIAEINARIDNIVGQTGESNTEIVDARKPLTGSAYPTLKGRLDAENLAQSTSINTEKNDRIAADSATNIRIDNLILESGGDSNLEVVDARVDRSGEVFPTLKARLDSDSESAGLLDGYVTDVKLSDDPGDIKGRFASHLAEIATDTTLGHVMVDGDTIKVDENGKIHSSVGELVYESKRYSIMNPHADAGSVVLKGQLHAHTTNSDGLDSPTAVVTAYKNAGYNFVAITDHDFLTPDPGVSGIIFIQSVEETNAHHVTAYDVTAQSTSTDSQTCINFHRTNAKLTNIAHPNWPETIVRKTQMQMYYDYNFTEVYNAITDTYGENHWDWALSTGKKVFALAVDDVHNINTAAQFNKGFVVVKAQANSKAAILDALRNGHFYASQGNDIGISLAGQTVTATSSASSNFTFIGYGGRVLKTVNGATSATYDIKGDEMYIRVKSARVSDSKAAWSQPIFIDCIGPDGRTNNSVSYEEGVWTPTIAGDSTAGSNTYTKQIGTYVRIGNLVTLSFDVQLATKDGAMSGTAVYIKGMPATLLRLVNTDITATAALWHSGIDLGTGYTSGLLAWNPFNAFMTVNKTHQTKIDQITPSQITATTRFLGTITYKL